MKFRNFYLKSLRSSTLLKLGTSAYTFPRYMRITERYVQISMGDKEDFLFVCFVLFLEKARNWCVLFS